jgi:1-acyl-sn-glycerol-3-phosphate acyltransferase
VALPECSDRRNLYFFVAKTICLASHHLLARPHVEMDEEIFALKRRGGAAFLYCGLHRSLWETTGVMPPLHYAGLPLPYVGMGDNLIKGRFFQNLSKKIGTFLVQRPSGRREMLESARRLREDVLSFLAHGLDVMLFPEGTRKNIPMLARYGDFFPAAFDAVLDYERNKDAILAANPALKPVEIYVVPLNVDYSRVREAEEMVTENAGKPRTLHVFDSFSMIRSIGDTYLSYGKPIRVADHLELNRKELAALCRQRCLDLVKILPINVASRAMLQLAPDSPVTPTSLCEGIHRVVERLRPYADRFRGFSLGDAHAEILRRARQVQLDFRRLLPENVGLYRLYASYIGHYLESSPAGAG